MKNTIALLLLSATFISCAKTETLAENNLIGQWLLTETLADPGDGSGTYQPVDSERKITFLTNGTFEMNQDPCPTIVRQQDSAKGTYNLNDSTLTVTGCRFEGATEDHQINFSVNEGHLFLLYPCIEPCGEKYKKLE